MIGRSRTLVEQIDALLKHAYKATVGHPREAMAAGDYGGKRRGGSPLPEASKSPAFRGIRQHERRPVLPAPLCFYSGMAAAAGRQPAEGEHQDGGWQGEVEPRGESARQLARSRPIRKLTWLLAGPGPSGTARRGRHSRRAESQRRRLSVSAWCPPTVSIHLQHQYWDVYPDYPQVSTPGERSHRASTTNAGESWGPTSQAAARHATRLPRYWWNFLFS